MAWKHAGAVPLWARTAADHVPHAGYAGDRDAGRGGKPLQPKFSGMFGAGDGATADPREVRYARIAPAKSANDA